MAVAKANSQKQLQLIRELLTRKGFEAEEPHDSGVYFKYKNFFYAIEYDEDDPGFYRVAFPLGLYHKVENRELRLAGVNLANSRSKLAKAYLDSDDDLNIAVDVIATTHTEFFDHLERYISAIRTAFDLFNEHTGG